MCLCKIKGTGVRYNEVLSFSSNPSVLSRHSLEKRGSNPHFSRIKNETKMIWTYGFFEDFSGRLPARDKHAGNALVQALDEVYTGHGYKSD